LNLTQCNRDCNAEKKNQKEER